MKSYSRPKKGLLVTLRHRETRKRLIVPLKFFSISERCELLGSVQPTKKQLVRPITVGKWSFKILQQRKKLNRLPDNRIPPGMTWEVVS